MHTLLFVALLVVGSNCAAYNNQSKFTPIMMIVNCINYYSIRIYHSSTKWNNSPCTVTASNGDVSQVLQGGLYLF